MGEIICERAVDEDVAAVIMASHSKSRVREFFIGSVANYCLHRCKKPVIVFRAPPTLNEAVEKSAQKRARRESRLRTSRRLDKLLLDLFGFTGHSGLRRAPSVCEAC